MSEPNHELRHALQRARWSPRDLVNAVNSRLAAVGAPQLAATAGHGWLRGSIPKGDVPQVVATVLSGATHTHYEVHDLWPTLARPHRADRTQPALAVDDLSGPWTTDTALTQLRQLAAATPSELAAVIPGHGRQLVTAARDGVCQTITATLLGRGNERVDPPFMDLIEEHLAGLRRLDDRVGGSAVSQRYVRGELLAVLDLVRSARFTPAVGARLLHAAAGLGQLGGWLAFDAGCAGAAQRHHLLAVRIAHSAADHAGAGNTLGMLAYQSAMAGRGADARALAEAAVAATKGSTATARARAHGRLATALAAEGDLYGYRDAADLARTLLQRRHPAEDPPYLYYFTADQLAAESGQALLALAATNPGHRKSLLAEAIAALTPLVTGAETYPRSGLLHSSYLAVAHLRAQDLDSAVATAMTLAARLPDIHSVRCRELARQLRGQLARRARNRLAARAVRELDRALLTT